MEPIILVLTILLIHGYIIIYRKYKYIKELEWILIELGKEMEKIEGEIDYIVKKAEKYTFLLKMLDQKTKQKFYNKYDYEKSKQ